MKAVKAQHPTAEELTTHLTKFFNVAFGRGTRKSREFSDSVSSALWDGYSPEEIRLAYWVARCSTGKAAWLGEQLRSDMLPHIVLRHHGRLNNVTGKEAKRWLDDLLARVGEMNVPMVKTLLAGLPSDMQDGERALLISMGVRCE